LIVCGLGVRELPHTTILRERTAALKARRERAKAALDRARAKCGATATIDARKIDAFSRLMNEKLDSGDTGARERRSYARITALVAAAYIIGRQRVSNGEIYLHQFLPILAHIIPPHLLHAGRLQSLPRN
jgi:hypothetical protein